MSLKEYIKRKEKEGHVKTKTTFKKKAGPTSSGEDAAIFDTQHHRGNSYNAVNRHLINKLKG